MTDLRNDLAKARDGWFESQEGMVAMSGVKDGVAVVEEKYLRNRLERAFIAGAKAIQPDEIEKRAFQDGFREGESKQAILEIRARDQFLQDFRDGKVNGEIHMPAEVSKDCPKQLGDIVKHNGRTANAAYQWGQTMHHDVDVLIAKLSENRKGLEIMVKELTKTLDEMGKKPDILPDSHGAHSGMESWDDS